MKENVKLEDILNLYNDISKKVKNKNKVYNFEKNKMQNINDIINILKSGNYNGGYYNIFLIREPKLRVVMALSLKDKIINHYFTKC